MKEELREREIRQDHSQPVGGQEPNVSGRPRKCTRLWLSLEGSFFRA